MNGVALTTGPGGLMALTGAVWPLPFVQVISSE